MSKISLNTNLFSLNAQRSLGVSNKTLQSSFEKLSSGLRINKASDDAAGLSISSKLDVDKIVANRGVRNINDGISNLNIADGAIEELSQILTRITELAQQSANGTLNSQQREALNLESSSLQNEYNRIIESTEFNERKILINDDSETLLQGGNSQLQVQVGEKALEGATDNRAGVTSIISTSSDGTIGDGFSRFSDITPDARYAVFVSSSTNLVSGDTNGVMDAFRKDLTTGETIRVSLASDGSESNGNALNSNIKISDNGRYVFFQSSATNLVSDDTNGVIDIYRKDVETGEIVRASIKKDGTEGTAGVSNMQVSSDGRYVFFDSASSNLVDNDTNGQTDIFRKDMLNGDLIRVNTSSDGVQASAYSSSAKISSGGRFVVFHSEATNIVPGTTAGLHTYKKDLETGELTIVSTDENNQIPGGFPISYALGISEDGRYAYFTSNDNSFVTGDTNSAFDVFKKDTLTGAIERISTNEQGEELNNSTTTAHISLDGRYMLFASSATNVIDGDTNGVQDLFRKDLLTNEIMRVGLTNNGTQLSASVNDANSASFTPDMRYVLFSYSGTELASGDTNSDVDVFMRDLSKEGVQKLAGVSVASQASAKSTLLMIDSYTEDIFEYKASLGANMSRANSFVNTLTTERDHFAEASSRITDVDVANETSKLTSSKIHQKITTALLAQANQQTQITLKLLGGI